MAFVWRFFNHEDDYDDLDQEAVCARLGHILSIPTVDGPTPDTTNWQAFDELVAFFRKSYPHVFEAATFEQVDHSIILDIPGSDTNLKPFMFMGHMDVVPVIPGTETDWTHPAFSGVVDDEYIWGRGALDMKDHVTGALEAAEYVLSHKKSLARRLILCFGQDEETTQNGARYLAQHLADKGIELEFLVDEGDYEIVDAAQFGAPGTYGMRVSLAEKGYADIKLTARSAGGHSSNPFGGTSLSKLAEAISRVQNEAWPHQLTEIDQLMLRALAPIITEEPMASLVGHAGEKIMDNADALVEHFLSKKELYPLVTTTVAPTMIEGGSSQANVMPQDMSATINFRMLPGHTAQQVYERVCELVADLGVEVELVGASMNDASRISRADGLGFKALERVAARYFVDPDTREPIKLIPSIVIGATDAHMYEGICDSCLRFSAFVADTCEVERGVHGTDERITKRAYLMGVRFFIRLIEEVCVA
ncbi:MAG: M20/M25/M40 family metallo-hydrolase [Atopobiaceae bacterium]|jgi:carboxypeptidase PM20D1